MDSVIFSQIPSIVLKKHKPAIVKERGRKRVKFQDDIQSKEVSSSRIEPELEENHEISQETDVDGDEPVDVDDSTRETADAIIQTETYIPATKSVETQTETSYSKSPLKDSREQYVSELEVNSLSSYRPIYSSPLQCVEQPPLKIGMTLPKGKKRKVFYPGEENAE